MNKFFLLAAFLILSATVYPTIINTANAGPGPRINIIKPEQNILVIANLIKARQSVLINFLKLGDVSKIDYVLTYNSNNIPQGVAGSINVNGEKLINREIFLGTCSKKSCIKHSPKNIWLAVTTHYKSGKVVTTNYLVK